MALTFADRLAIGSAFALAHAVALECTKRLAVECSGVIDAEQLPDCYAFLGAQWIPFALALCFANCLSQRGAGRLAA